MSVPVERIREVIAELEQQIGFCEIVLESDPFDTESIAEKQALDFAVGKLQKVVNEHEATPEPKEQIRSPENDD